MLGRALAAVMSSAKTASPVGMVLGDAAIVSCGFSVAVLDGAIATTLVMSIGAVNRTVGNLDDPMPTMASL